MLFPFCKTWTGGDEDQRLIQSLGTVSENQENV